MARGLVIPVAIAGAAHEDGGDHLRPHRANDVDHVGEDPIVGPAGDRLGLGLREAVIDDARPALLDAVRAAGGEHLHGADESEGVEEVGRHDVRAALAAIQGEEVDADARRRATRR